LSGFGEKEMPFVIERSDQKAGHGRRLSLGEGPCPGSNVQTRDEALLLVEIIGELPTYPSGAARRIQAMRRFWKMAKAAARWK
jgi:hypothetical protein